MILRSLMKHMRDQSWVAVGLDFLIVVLGVFLGIQLGNWNEALEIRARERVYLEQLLIDLESDITTGQRGVRYADEIDDAAERLLMVLEGKPGADDISDADLVVAVVHAGYAYLPIGQSATYEEMISTGALGEMKNVELKRALAHYYDWMDSGRQWDSLLREEQYAYRTAIRGILNRQQFAWARANAGSEARLPLPAFERADFTARAVARPAIVDSLHSMGAVQERLRGDSRRIQEYAAELSALVRKELEE